MNRATVTALCAVLFTITARAQAVPPTPRTSSSASSATHRVVVVNGETLVDERSVDGRPASTPRTKLDPASPPDANALLRDLMERVRAGLPGDARDLLDRADPIRGAATSSHTHRVVIENGKVLVDEETRDGKPVRSRGFGGALGGPGHADAHAEASSEASHSAASREANGSAEASDSASSDVSDGRAAHDGRSTSGGTATRPSQPTPATPMPVAPPRVAPKPVAPLPGLRPVRGVPIAPPAIR